MNNSSASIPVLTAADLARTVPEFGVALSLSESGRLAEATALFSALSDRAPTAVMAQHQLALIAARQNDWVRAEDVLRRALTLSPGQPMLLQTLVTVLQDAGRLSNALDVMLDLGCALHALGDLPGAIAVYHRMLAIDPLRYGAWANLGTDLGHLAEPEAAAKHLFRAVVLAGRIIPVLKIFAQRLEEQVAQRGLELNAADAPTVPPMPPTGPVDKVADILTSLGKAMSDLGHAQAAVACHRMSVEMRPVYDLGHWNLSLALLALGQYEEGWSEYEWRWLREPTLDPRRLLPLPRWTGKSGQGQKLMVFAEQGYGDTLQFAPLVSRLAQQSARVVFQVHQPMVRLLAHNLNSDKLSVISLPNHPDEIGTDEPLDGFVAQMSLPHFMGLKRDELPIQTRRITAIPSDMEFWSNRLGPRTKPRVGIVWAGRPQHSNDRNRSMPMEALRDLLTPDFGVEWISLQRGAREQEFSELLPKALNPGDELRDFADTAALITQLDLVISVDTGTAHLAAAMGCPVWMMLPFAADWRWEQDQEKTDWYPTMSLFRQPRIGDWANVVQRISAGLSGVFS